MTLTAPREHATTVATQGQAILGGDSRFAVAPGERVPRGPRGGRIPLSRPAPTCASAAREPPTGAGRSDCAVGLALLDAQRQQLGDESTYEETMLVVRNQVVGRQDLRLGYPRAPRT